VSEVRYAKGERKRRKVEREGNNSISNSPIENAAPVRRRSPIDRLPEERVALSQAQQEKRKRKLGKKADVTPFGEEGGKGKSSNLNPLVDEARKGERGSLNKERGGGPLADPSDSKEDGVVIRREGEHRTCTEEKGEGGVLKEKRLQSFGQRREGGPRRVTRQRCFLSRRW